MRSYWNVVIKSKGYTQMVDRACVYIIVYTCTHWDSEKEVLGWRAWVNQTVFITARWPLLARLGSIYWTWRWGSCYAWEPHRLCAAGEEITWREDRWGVSLQRKHSGTEMKCEYISVNVWREFTPPNASNDITYCNLLYRSSTLIFVYLHLYY